MGPTQPPVQWVPKPFPGRLTFGLFQLHIVCLFRGRHKSLLPLGLYLKAEFVFHPFFSQIFLSESLTSVELIAQHWAAYRLSDFILKEEARGFLKGNVTTEFYKKLVDPTMLRTNFQSRGL
jgi:hypothetical protein